MSYFTWYWILTPVFFAAIAWHYSAGVPFKHEIKLQSEPIKKKS